MRYFIICLFSLWTLIAQSAEVPIVELQTTMGTIVLELNAEKAPKSVENFLSYAKEGFYEGTIFHRVINNFMVQGGGYTKEYEKKPTHAPVVNEATNGLKNLRGTVAMARTGDPDSATSQFFINVKDNDFLDYRPSTSGGSGYTVFAKVIKGMETAEKIQQVATGASGPFQKDVPQTPILIEKVKISKAAATSETDASPLEGDKTESKASQPVVQPAKTKPVTTNTEKTPPATEPKTNSEKTTHVPAKVENATTDTEKSPSEKTSPAKTKPVTANTEKTPPATEPKMDSEKTTHASAKVEAATTDTEKSPISTALTAKPKAEVAGTEKSQPAATEVKTDVDEKAGESTKAKTVAPSDKTIPAPDAPSKPDKPEAPPS
ncbi:MAG: hypothetical protein BWK79_06205 [Beggiatoa sp. IS2]|nr:MAG: hypothetical protein BWK79_06205 [Beggiatoa sp. IS2]